MTTECTTERLEFERFRRQRVVRFDRGARVWRRAAAAGAGAADGAVPAVECVFPGSPRPAADAASVEVLGSARAGAGAGLRGLAITTRCARASRGAAMRGGRPQ